MKFTKATGAKVQGDAVVFEIEISGVVRQFEISGDVLRRNFGAADDTAVELLQAFERGADAVRDATRRVRSTPTEGRVLLGAGDFDEGAGSAA